MKIGIVCAGDDELRPFLPIIENHIVTERAGLEFHEGSVCGKDVVALFSGVCKVNAAIASQILIDVFEVDIIINSGTAGGMNSELDIFDTVISTEVCYHDVLPANLTEFYPWMETPFFKADEKLVRLSLLAASKTETRGRVFAGRMVTGENFITDEGRERINRLFAPLSVDMETASIAHVCHVNSIPFVAIRCITDTAKHSGVETFEENCCEASAISKEITIGLIKELSSDYKDTY